jgi:hypothetical protein
MLKKVACVLKIVSSLTYFASPKIWISSVRSKLKPVW